MNFVITQKTATMTISETGNHTMTTQDTSEQVYFAPTAIQEYEERCRLEAAAARKLSDQIPGTIAKADGKSIVVDKGL